MYSHWNVCTAYLTHHPGHGIFVWHPSPSPFTAQRRRLGAESRGPHLSPAGCWRHCRDWNSPPTFRGVIHLQLLRQQSHPARTSWPGPLSLSQAPSPVSVRSSTPPPPTCLGIPSWAEGQGSARPFSLNYSIFPEPIQSLLSTQLLLRRKEGGVLGKQASDKLGAPEQDSHLSEPQFPYL